MICLQLFLSFLQIGALSFGGGYAVMPLIQSQIVTQHSWLSMSEFTDLVTIAEMTPGPIAVNAATFVGTKLAGVPGALAATAGCILPACILVTLLAKLYLKYRNLSLLQSVLSSLRPAVVAMIASAGLLILVNAFWGGNADGGIRRVEQLLNHTAQRDGPCKTQQLSGEPAVQHIHICCKTPLQHPLLIFLLHHDTGGVRIRKANIIDH